MCELRGVAVWGLRGIAVCVSCEELLCVSCGGVAVWNYCPCL